MVGLILIIWIISAVINFSALLSKDRLPDFMPYLFVTLCPVVNTIYAIYVIKVKARTFDLKEFINQIKLD
jgi:hypothetical protein